MPRPLAVAGAILLAAAVVTLIGIPLTSSVQQMWPKFDFEFGKFVDRAKQSSLVERLGLNNLLPKDASSWTASLSAAFVQASSIASKTFLVIVFTLFILLGRRGPIRRTTGVLSEIEVRVQLYISQMVLLSAIAGILVWIVLWILGVEMAALFGVLAFLLNFIPTIGSIIATLLPLPVILIDPHMGCPGKDLRVAIPGGHPNYSRQRRATSISRQRAGSSPHRCADLAGFLEHDLGSGRRISGHADDRRAPHRP